MVTVIDPVTNLMTVGTYTDVQAMLTRLIDHLKTANITAMRDENVLGNVCDQAPKVEAALDSLRQSHRCVKDVRGTGFFYAIELMADHNSGRELSDSESLTVLREVLPESFKRTKVILRGDDRGATMIMVSPPLVADDDVLDDLLHGIDGMLTDIEKAVQP